VIQTLSKQSRQAHVLLVEDNADHAFLAGEAFGEASHDVKLHHVNNGENCLAFLRRQAPYENAPRPDLILLDIHMPRMNGYEVMQAISGDAALADQVVVALTTSSEAIDVNRMYQLGCNSYLVKPSDFEAFTAAIRQLADYWFGLVVLPRKPI
jgi:chemotaxis family two-component system response regulator Rcp1